MWSESLKKLNAEERNIIINKGTERPFSGKYNSFYKDGTYTCKVCNTSLYKSDSKFDGHCGWPSFDDSIKGAVKEEIDADGIRNEILCAKCGAHLGHVFRGENITPKNTRFCVNSLSLNFQEKKLNEDKAEFAYFAGGCFWGVEYLLEKLDGVVDVTSGFMGGNKENPSYEEVIYNNTGHLETVKVLYYPAEITYKDLAKAFFEIHNPFQANGQGPDIGSQYLSAIFVQNEKEREIVKDLISILNKNSSTQVATKILDIKSFYKAEDYHQNYYKNNQTLPYCHSYIKRF